MRELGTRARPLTNAASPSPLYRERRETCQKVKRGLRHQYLLCCGLILSLVGAGGALNCVRVLLAHVRSRPTPRDSRAPPGLSFAVRPLELPSLAQMTRLKRCRMTFLPYKDTSVADECFSVGLQQTGEAEVEDGRSSVSSACVRRLQATTRRRPTQRGGKTKGKNRWGGLES